MRKVSKLLMITIVGLIFTSCATRHADIVVAKFDNDKITLGEFEKAYAKNVGGIESAEKDSVENYKKFLELYVPYKMKLRDAYVRNFQNDEDLIAELNDYKEKVGVSYIEEKQIVTPGMKKFYKERSEEVRVSHIMFKMGSDDVLKIAQAVLDSIKNGKSFEEMVSKYSQDSFSKGANGDIYWFTAGQIIPAFEKAAYNTPVGEVYPEVVKTKFGYHILKVTDREPRKYKIRAKHILVKNDEKQGNMVDAIPGEKPLAKITRIKKELMDGVDFDSLAIKYSDDQGSGAKGGDLGFFERRMMVQPFDEAAFKLNVGEVSDIVTTRFGYHIIKVTEVLDYPSYEDEVETLRELYKKNRYQSDYDEYVEGLKTEYNFKMNNNLVTTLGTAFADSTFSSEFLENSKYLMLKDSTLVSVDSKNYNVESFFEFLFAQPDYANRALSGDIVTKGASSFGYNLLLKMKSKSLMNSDKEFTSLMNDYKNGIFIFKLQESEVWNKVNIDTTKLREEYNNSKDKFTISGTVNFNEIFSRSKEKIEEYYEMLKNGVDFDSVAAKYTERPGFKAKFGRHGFKDVNDNQLSKKANSLNNDGDFSEPFVADNGWSIVILRKKVPSRIKTFEEALPELSSKYQENESKRLENNYINVLNNFYQPKYFYDKLTNAYKAENN
ncbi:MAG: peptidylprolyl isomerase [Bacteroidetes bacterium]|nr:peptidylprolyl isomerase [Bacteroidota bacterium]MBU1114698.1 peptidylprolyl isomerase [Bacteroidota bacterium]MBU1798900.1 peptidylprolyl isomerase [Bacteroidota bacterium]